MTYQEETERLASQRRISAAIIFATNAHRTQTDKTGRMYILHPLRVMLAVEPLGELHMIAAVLHDVVEDTSRTLEDIQCAFGAEVAEAVDALSRREDETYRQYVVRCNENLVAKVVKVADVLDNASPARSAPELKGLQKRYDLTMRILIQNPIHVPVNLLRQAKEAGLGEEGACQ